MGLPNCHLQLGERPFPPLIPSMVGPSLSASHQRWGHEVTGLRLLQGHIEDVHGALGPCLLE